MTRTPDARSRGVPAHVGLVVAYYKDGGYRRKVGLIGEGGLKAGVAYRVDPDTSEFVEA